MRGKGNKLINIALITFIIYSLVDRFIVEISDIIAIPILLLGIIFILLGGYIKKNKKN